MQSIIIDFHNDEYSKGSANDFWRMGQESTKKTSYELHEADKRAFHHR